MFTWRGIVIVMVGGCVGHQGVHPGPPEGCLSSSAAEGALCAKQADDARGQTVVGRVPGDKKTGSAQITTSKVCRGGVCRGGRVWRCTTPGGRGEGRCSTGGMSMKLKTHAVGAKMLKLGQSVGQTLIFIENPFTKSDKELFTWTQTSFASILRCKEAVNKKK